MTETATTAAGTGGASAPADFVPGLEGVVAFETAIAELREQVPAALVPLLAIVDELPVRTSGKVDRAVSRITGVAIFFSRSTRRMLRPSRPGTMMSSTKASYGMVKACSSARSPSSTASTANPISSSPFWVEARSRT